MKVPSIVVATLATALIAGGVAYIAYPEVRSFVQRQAGANQNLGQLQQTQQVAVKEPTLGSHTWQRLRIVRLGIDLAVTPGRYNSRNRTWQLDKTHAFTMPDTAVPTIYGHNIPAVFGALDGIAKDEVLELTDEQGRVHAFKYTGEALVNPSDTHILDDKAPNTLRLITCEAPTFSLRRVLSFTYIGDITESQKVS